MVNPIVQFTPGLKVWGQSKDAHLPLPKNPWLRRRRLGGVKYEVERLFSRFSEQYNRLRATKEGGLLTLDEAKTNLWSFLSSEYERNAVYYRFINMRIGIRRMAVYLLGRYIQESAKCPKNRSANTTT